MAKWQDMDGRMPWGAAMGSITLRLRETVSTRTGTATLIQKILYNKAIVIGFKVYE